MSEQSKAIGEEVTKVPTKEERRKLIKRLAPAIRYPIVIGEVVAKEIFACITALEHVEAERDQFQNLAKHYDGLITNQTMRAFPDSGGESDALLLKRGFDELLALREENARLKAEVQDLNEELHPRSKDAWPGSQGSYNQRSPEEDQI